MGIGTSDGEYYDDRLSHALASEPSREAQAIPSDVQRVYITSEKSETGSTMPLERPTEATGALESGPGVEVRPEPYGLNPPDRETPFPRPRASASIMNAFRGMAAGAEDAITNFPQNFKEGLQGMIDTIKGAGEASQGKLPEWAVNPETGEVHTSHQVIEKANNLAMLMVGGPAPVAAKMADGTLGSFMGVNSKTIDKGKIFRAQRMESEGATPDAIWEKTGTFRGADKRWRQEINDRDMALKSGAFDLQLTPKGDVETVSLKTKGKNFFGEQKEPLRLPDVVQHPELFKAYDFLKSTKVVPLAKEMVDRGVEGMMDTEHNTLHLAPNLKEKQARSVIMHEVTHAIQQKEGFINGTDPHWFRPEGWDKVTKQLTDAEDWLKKQFVKKRLTPDQYETYKGAVSAEHSFNQMLERYGVASAEDVLPPHILENIQDAKNLGVYKQLKNIVEGERHLETADATYFENYMRAAGEVEARNVQARLNYNAYERAKIAPIRTESRARYLQQDEVGIPLTERDRIRQQANKEYDEKNRPTSMSSEPTQFRRAANDNLHLEQFVEDLQKRMKDGTLPKEKAAEALNELRKLKAKDSEKYLPDNIKNSLEDAMFQNVTKPHQEFIKKYDELHAFGQDVLGKKGGWTELNVARYNKMGRALGGEWEDLKFKE